VAYSPKWCKKLQALRPHIADLYRPAQAQQALRHGAAHIADADHADWKGRHRFGHDCTSRLDLAIDINIPSANPKVTMAVPP
jgi:hypothetical protein